ncbi:MAG: hypothetical protein AAGG75_09075 [Bacteroidota bacterium]
MARILVTLLGIALVLTNVGCNKSADSDPNINLLIDDEFNVSLWEDLNLDGRDLRFRLSTINDQDCLNSNIDYSLRIQGEDIILSINDLMDPPDCISGMAPANASVLIGQLENGSYPLQINLKNEIVNEGALKVTHTQYSIELNSDHGIVLDEERLLRIPDQTIWGFVGYKNAALSTVNEFTEAAAAVTAPKLLTIGNYGYFTIADGNEIVLNEQSEFSNTQTLILHLDESNAAAFTELVDTYRSNYGEELEIKIYTDKGEEL